MQKKANDDLVAEVQELRAQLEEAQETLNAIRRGEVDGLVISTPKGEQVYTISGAERPYRALIEDMREGAVLLSDDNTVLYCNSGFAKMMRRSAEKIVGVKIDSMVCPTYIPALIELLTLSRAHMGAVAKEVTLQASEDVLIPTLMSVNSLQTDTLKNTFLVVTDLSEHMEEEVKRYTTELELAQIALSESEQRWATTLASIGDAVIATDKLGNIKFMNAVAEELTGWPLNEASKKPIQEIFKIVNEFSRKTVDDPVTKVLDKGMICGLANHTILIRKDKTEVPIDDSGAPIKDKEGKITGVVLIFRDITERRKAEETLRESEERFSEAFHANAAASIVSRWSDGKYVDVNDAFLRLFGFKREEVIGHTSPELGLYLSLEDREKTLKLIDANKLENVEMTFKAKNGGLVNTILTTRKISIAKETHIVTTMVDITKRKKAEEKLEEYRNNLERLVEERTRQLKDSERLAAIGATAGMVGHDIRNPLQAISGDLYLAKEGLASCSDNEGKKEALESIMEIEKNIDYINKIVQDLQDYARPLNPNPGEADFKQIIEKMLQKNGIPKNINVSVNVEDEAKKVVADVDYLNRILYNLVTNAVQAMPKGGKLSVHVYKEENDILIAVKDTGVGIPKEIQGKMFTPMFTTKSKGQGFGLPVVKRMTESLGGTVSFESQEGKGTTFEVRLPTQKVKT